MDIEKDFDTWNSEKKLINRKMINKGLFFYPREIWWCSAGLNIGVEVNGKHENFERPMLILKKFNSHMLWVLPLTTQDKNNKYYYKLRFEATKSRVIISQIKTISTKRLLRKISSISNEDFKNIIAEILDILKIENPLAGAFSEAEATNKSIIN